MRVHRKLEPRFSFWLKALATVGLVLLGDLFFFSHGIGATAGVFALTWLGLTFALRPAPLRDRRALIAAAAAGVCAAFLLDRFTLVGWALFWTALTTSTLSPRTGVLPDVGAWARRLPVHAFASLVAPFEDMARVKRLQARPEAARSLVLGAILPVGGGVLFLTLFARANPLIGAALETIRLPNIDIMLVLRVGFWLILGVTVWATMRPARRPTFLRAAPRRRSTQLWLFGVSVGSVISALVLFNVLFAVENGLDLAFLWSCAPLPAGVTLADYAHRGAYPLVLTALLAGGFSLLLLREGSPTASRPLIRWLVGAWVAQNVMLSASSLLRMVDYVEAYSLTQLRLAALLWMGLTMLGLALIGWRMLRRKTASWLINANAVALAIVLCFASVADLGSVAAWWNVSHARDLGGRGAALDVCYLQGLGPSALLPLLHVEKSGGDRGLRERAAFARQAVLDVLATQQQDWHRWSWRGARRLAAAEATAAVLPHQPDGMWKTMSCEGPIAPPIHAIAPVQPVMQAPSASTTLTPGA